MKFFQVLHLMKECYNYFNTLYEMYANNKTLTFLENFGFFEHQDVPLHVWQFQFMVQEFTHL